MTKRSSVTVSQFLFIVTLLYLAATLIFSHHTVRETLVAAILFVIASILLVVNLRRE